jgi:hypothetical protein
MDFRLAEVWPAAGLELRPASCVVVGDFLNYFKPVPRQISVGFRRPAC